MVAANRIGAAREVLPMSKEGLYEFAAVAQSFEDMQRRLLRFVDERTQMLAAISHDLRSSLTRLKFAVEELPAREQRTAIVGEVDDLHAMVDSTLAFATGEARMAPSQRIDVAALMIVSVSPRLPVFPLDG